MRSKDIEATAEIANFHNFWSGEQPVSSCERGELLLIERQLLSINYLKTFDITLESFESSH